MFDAPCDAPYDARMMHCDARALDLCPCITRDVPYDARMMHRDALMRLMHLGLGDAWCIKPRSLYHIVDYVVHAENPFQRTPLSSYYTHSVARSP